MFILISIKRYNSSEVIVILIYYFFTSTFFAGQIFKVEQKCLGETALTEFSIIFVKYLSIITSQSFLYDVIGKSEQMASNVSLISSLKIKKIKYDYAF